MTAIPSGFQYSNQINFTVQTENMELSGSFYSRLEEIYC